MKFIFIISQLCLIFSVVDIYAKETAYISNDYPKAESDPSQLSIDVIAEKKAKNLFQHLEPSL